MKTKKGEEKLEADIVLSAVGIKSNIENIGLEEVGIATERDKILVNDYYQTNFPGYMPLEMLFLGRLWPTLLLPKEFFVLKNQRNAC